MDIWFYHLLSQPLDRALPNLLERSLQRGWRAVVQTRSEERLEALDQLLWTYTDDSFLAHGTPRDGDAELQGVYLTTGDENPNEAKIRFFVDGAEIATALAEAGGYERAVLMFDGGDSDQVDAARAQWRALKQTKAVLSYWRQTESGGWEKVAG